jgi:hypothetical protein
MNPTMTQHLGQQPGRARLGAADRWYRIPSAAVAPVACPAADVARGADAAGWCREASVPTTDGTANVANAAGHGMGSTTGLGFRSIKRTARHLATRST